MKFKVERSAGVPIGSYAAKFIEAEQAANDYGEAVVLKFQVTGGEHTGSIATRWCSPNLTQKSTLFQFVAAMAGRKPEAGEEIDVASFYGTPGMVVVGEAKSGNGTRVETFIRTG